MATITDIYKKAVDNGVLSNQVSEERFSQMLQNDQERKAYWEFAQKKKPGFYSSDYDTFSKNSSTLLAASVQQPEEEKLEVKQPAVTEQPQGAAAVSTNPTVKDHHAPTTEQEYQANLTVQNEDATPLPENTAAPSQQQPEEKKSRKSFWQRFGEHAYQQAMREPSAQIATAVMEQNAQKQVEQEKQRKEAEAKQKETTEQIEKRRPLFETHWNGVDGKDGDAARLDRVMQSAVDKAHAAESKIADEYGNTYRFTGMPGGTRLAMGLEEKKAYNKEASPDVIMEAVTKSIDEDYQAALAALNKKTGGKTNAAVSRPMTDEELAAMYQQAGIMSPEDYEWYRQYVQGKMQEKFAAMDVPQNKMDYFVNKFMQSNLIGQLATLYTDTPYQRASKAQGVETYEKEHDDFGTKAVGFGADVAGLLVDPTMIIMPMAGSALGGAAVRGIAGQTLRRVGYASAEDIAARAMAQRGILRTANRLAGSAFTFAGIDATHDVVNQLYQPIYNEETGKYEDGDWHPWQTAKAAIKGSITGTVFGATGLLGDHVQHVVGEAWNRAAGVVAGKATHFVGGTNAMVGSSVVSQILQGKSVTDINWGEEYANAAAMQLVFDLQGGVRNLEKVRRDAAEHGKSLSLPQAFVANWQRMKIDPYAGSFTPEEIEQFNKAGYEGTNGYELLLNLNGGKEYKNLNELYDVLERVSQDPTIDTQAKYRLASLVYGKVEGNVRPVMTDIYQDEQGRYVVRTYDTAGQNYETRQFTNEKRAQDYAAERRIETQTNLKHWAEGVVRNATFAQEMQRIAINAVVEIQKKFPQYTTEQIYDIMREAMFNPHAEKGTALAQDSDRAAIRTLFEQYLSTHRPAYSDALGAIRQEVADRYGITADDVRRITSKDYKELDVLRERGIYDDYVSRLVDAMPKARKAQTAEQNTQYAVTRADDPTRKGYIISGKVELKALQPWEQHEGQTDDGRQKMEQIITNDDVVIVRWEDGTFEQLSARNLTLVEQFVNNHPEAHKKLMDDYTIRELAHKFHAGQNIEMVDANGNTSTSHVISVSDEGVEVEIIDPNGNPNTTIVPAYEALTNLRPIAQEQPQFQDGAEYYWNPNEETTITIHRFDDGSVTLFDEQGNPAVDEQGYLRTISNDEFDKIKEEYNLTRTGTDDETLMEAAGSEEHPETAEQQPTVPNTDTMSSDELGAATVEYMGDKSAAAAYLEAERDKAQAEVKKLAKQKVTKYTDIADFKAQNDALQARKKAATDRLSKLEKALVVANHYQTQAEQEAAAARKAEEEAKRSARRKTEEAKTTNAAPAERWQAAPKAAGNTVSRTLPDGTIIRGRYVLSEAGTATPSHDPANGWNTSNGYPVTEDGRNINDRDYKNDKDAQQLTTQMAQTYDGQAIAQVPVVSSEGIVYDGNGRTIAGNIAAANNTDAAYIQALTDNAANFGFTPEQVASMQHPRVYMQLDEDLPYNTTTLAKFNAQEKKTQSNTNRAISQGKKLTEATRDGILSILDNYGSLDAFFASEAGANDIVKSLLSNGIITQQEVAGLTEKTDRGFVLSPVGKDYVTDLLLGSLFDEQTIRMFGNDKGLKQSILRAVPSIVENRRLGDYALTNDINGAIRLLYEARQAGQAYSLYIRQVDAFEGKVSDRFSPFEMLLAEEMSSGVEAFRQVLTLYNTSARDEANGQAGLFEPRTVEDIKNEILQHYAKRPTAAVEPTAGTTPASRPENPQTQSSVPSPQAGNERVDAEGYTREQAESKQQSAKDSTKDTPKGERTGGKGSKQSGEKKEKKSENKIFTEDAYEAARRRMHERLNRLNAGLDPEMLSDGLIMAGYHVEKGARKFADFAKRMIEEFGDKIRPYLKSFYNGLRDLPEAEALSREMDDYATVAQFDVKAIALEPKTPENTAPAQFKVGDKVRYTTADGKTSIEATIEDVNEDGTYNIKYEPKPYMPTTAVNISADRIKSTENLQNTLPSEKKNVPLRETEKRYECNGKSIVVDKADYKTYITDEAKALLAELSKTGKKPLAVPAAAYISYASIDGVKIPAEILLQDPNIEAAQAKIDERSGQSLQLSDEQIKDYAMRLLDAEHGSAVLNEKGKINKRNGEEDFSGEVAQERKALFVIGRPAGGKSSVYANPLSAQNKARIIDSDVVKPWLDGFDGGDGAGYVQEASARVADVALQVAMQRGDNMVIPKIGGNSIIKMAADLRQAGYSVELYYNEVSEGSSIMRASARFAETGRYLAIGYLKSIGNKAEKTFINYANKTLKEVQDERPELFKSAGETNVGGYGQNTGFGAGKEIGSGDYFFSKAEWKNNDVAFGEPTRLVWSSESDEPIPGTDSVRTHRQIGEVRKSTHTKTGEDIWIVKPAARVSDEEFKLLKDRAKACGGYYSNFAKNRGFIFKSEEDANQFNRINDEDITTNQTSADTETACNAGEIVSGEASSVTRDRRDSSRTEREPGTESTKGGVREPEQVELTHEEADAEVDTRLHTIDKIDEATDKINDQLAVLGYYEADTSDPKQINEQYGYLKTAEAKAVKDIDRLAKQLASDLGIEVSKRKVIAKANIAPAGGDISFRLPLENGKELYLTIALDSTEDENALELRTIMWRVEDPQASGTARYIRQNHSYIGKAAAEMRYIDLLNDIRKVAAEYLPKTNATKLEVAKKVKEQTDSKKKDKESIPNSQPVLDLFGDVADTLNEAAAQKEQTEETPQEDLHHGYKVGDTIRHKKAGEVKIVDFEIDGRPVIDSFGAKWLTEIANWEDIEPINTNNNGELRTNGRGESSTAKAGTAGQPRNENGALGGSQQPQNERPAGGRVGTSGTSHRLHDGERGGGTPLQPAEQTVTPTEPTDIEPSQWHNTRNFQARGGERLAPTTPKARYEANLAAIRLLKQLQDDDRQATPQEMDILSQYSGWGGLGEFFKGEPGTAYYSQHGENSPYQTLASIMTPEELEAAQLSRNSAYYTPENVINAMWQIAERLGFKGGNILEGSAGIGNIFALMPRSIAHRSNLTAVEIDDITAGILAQLYPDATTHHAGFQDVEIPNNSQDLTITNVPFVTDLHVYDKQEKDLSKRFGSIHDFCIAKNVRKLKQGGLGIFISTSNTLDKSKDLRVWLNDSRGGNADVIGAFRLNNETFGGTNATSDIIVVRKRVNGQQDPRAINVLDTSTGRISKQQQDEVWDKKAGKYIRPEDKEVKVIYNNYFTLHPDDMGGVMEYAFEHGSTWRENTLSCYPSADINQAERLKKWVERMEQFDRLQTYEEQPKNALTGDYETIEGEMPYGALVVNSKGEICNAYGSRGGKKTLVPIEGINSNKVKGYPKSQVANDYNAIKQAIADLLQAQTKDISDAELKPYLRKLNSVYDDFVRKYGSLNRNTSLSFLRNDVQWASIAAIEKVKESVDVNGKKKVEVSKTDLFNKRVVGVQAVLKAENAKDGVILSMQQFGTIQPDKIAEWLGKPTEEVETEILNTRLGFRNPQTGNIEAHHQYLSGNVREKLAYAEEHNTDGSLDANIEELRKVVPVDIPAHLIEFSIGSTWIPAELYKQYAQEKYDIQDFKLNHVASSWVANEVWGAGEKDRAGGVYSETIGKQVYGHELMVAAMNNVPVVVSKVERHYDGTTETITDKVASAACSDKISQIKDDFVEWARGKMQQDSGLADRVQKIYNERFNAVVPMLKVDDVFLSKHLPGQNSAKYDLYPHQQQAVARGLTQPLMLAHEVGTGKTISLISTAMEMRRLGTAKKPMIVVQNATTQQFVSDAKDLYPNAKILTVSDRDRTAEGRQEFYAKIKYNDWDLIIIPQSVFDMIPDSESRMQDFINEKIEEKMHAIEAAKEAGVNSTITKRMEKELVSLQGDLETNNMSGKKTKSKDKDAKKEAEKRANAQARAKEMLDRKTDHVEDFDDIGIDALLIDEAHNYKHLGFATMMQRGVKGVDPSYSKRAAALYLKCQSVYERTGHKNVIFATGTPISNTAAEIWTFMKYLMPKSMLKENDIYYFDDFVHNFGKINEQLEFATNGKFKANNRFAQYNNVPELMRLWLSVADCTLTREVGQVNDKVPELEGGKAQDIFLEQSPSLMDIMAAVRAELEAYEKMSGKEKRENSHIPLTMYGIAKRAAIDPRLVDEDAADEPLSKTNRAVTEVLRSLNDSKKYNGTVAIFCDSYQNKQSGFNLFNDIKDKLTAQGVPANQIAIIRSEMSDTAKQKVFDAVREGDIRVIMGSTQTLGTGVNIQTRLHTLIHMDAPDRPMDYTQRNGRILRQGNMHKAWGIPVRVLRFGVEDSLDVTSYQRLKTKAGFIDSIMNGKSMIDNNLENRVLEDVDEGIFDNPVAMLSGSQYALMKSQAERDLRKWKAREQQHRIDQILIAKKTKDNDTIIAYRTKKIADDEKLIDLLEKTFPNGKVSEYNINGTVCHTAEEVKSALKELNKDISAESDKLRADRWGDKKSLAYTLSFNGMPFHFFVNLTRKANWKDGKTVISIEKDLSYSAAPLGEKPIASFTKVPDRLLETIESDVLTGKQARNEIVQSKASIERAQKESELMRAREGKPFAHQAELEKAQALVDEYTEKMKEEMAAKEAKYAAQSHKAVNLDKLDSEDDASDTGEAEFSIFGGNNGYVGYSKSVRAVEAEDEGKRSISNFDNEFIGNVNDLLQSVGAEPINITKAKQLAKEATPDEWHHTSMYGNKTNYYSPETIARAAMNDEQKSAFDKVQDEKWKDEAEQLNRELKDKRLKAEEKQRLYEAVQKATKEAVTQVLAEHPEAVRGTNFIGYWLNLDGVHIQVNNTLYEKSRRYEEGITKAEAKKRADQYLSDLRAEVDKKIKEQNSVILTEAQQLATETLIDAIKIAGIEVKTVSQEQAQKIFNPELAEAQIVYHGSGTKFDRFNNSYMGTGEGTQVFGWGAYVTENKEIGEYYAKSGQKHINKFIYNGEELTEKQLAAELSDKVSRFNNTVLENYIRVLSQSGETAAKEMLNSEIEHLKDRVANVGFQFDQALYDKSLAELKALANAADNIRKETTTTPTNLYTVEIPNDNGKNYFNYYDIVPQSEIERILNALPKSSQYNANILTEIEKDKNSISGEELYGLMSVYLGGDKAASQFLGNLGYIGIKYPTNMLHGGNKDGLNNFVIFNENDLQIKDRVEFMRTSGSTIYGYAQGGKIYLTPEGLNPNTPIHEYAHLWVAAIRHRAKDLYRNLQDLFSRANLPDMWAELDRDPHYAHLSDEAKLSEIISRFSGKRGAERMEAEAQKHIDEAKKQGKQQLANAISLRERMRNLLRRMWNWVGENLFHIKNFGSREEAADRILYDLLNGTDLGEPTKSKAKAEFSIGENTAGATPHLTRSEIVTKTLVQNAQNDYNTMQSAIKKVGKDIRGIRKAMRLQSEYDRNVVSSLLNLYSTLMQSNSVWAGYMPDTSHRIASQIVYAIGKENISKEVNTIFDYIVDAQAKAAQRQWDKLRNTPIEKINISGVVSQGKVAIQGQHALRALNEALDNNLSPEQLEELIGKAMSNETSATDESLRTQFKGRWIGYSIAQQHMERIDHLKQERMQLQDELDAARNNKSLKPAARRQLVENIKEAMRDNYLEQADAYAQSYNDLQEYVAGQAEKAKGFIEKQNANREKIRSYAAKDLEGIATNPNRLRTKREIARSIWDAFASPMRDLQSMLRLCGMNTPDGEGYLYNHFMRNWIDGADREQAGLTEASRTLDTKMSELTHGKYKTWEEAARKINDKSHNKFSITMLNGVDGSGNPIEEEIPLNTGNALYIYAVNKMEDGRMKLNAMNITEEDVEKLTNEVRDVFGQEILDVVDWIQTEYFSQLRNRYNPIHEDLFGAPMDAIENYFPLRINPNARQKNEDLGSPDTDASRLLTGTSTGAIKRRTRNSLPLDVRNADFFTEVIRHIAQMERWSAFAQLTRDANILFSDIDFRNRVKGMNGTIYGKGDQLYNHMKDAFKVALGTYQSKTDPFSEFTLNMAKGVTSAKINFRTFTALKQLASFPAFLTYMTDGVFVKSYLHNWMKPHETMKWARTTLPNFDKRISKRDMGDMRLMQRSTDWQWNKRLLELSSKYGMAANVFFDVLTCATGARAVYDSKYADYINKGYAEAEAVKRARQDAEVSFNTSQQSSEGAFMAPVQVDRNLFTAALTVFRTSNFQYTRNFFYAVRTLSNNRGKKDEMTASRAKQYIADGLTEEQARRAAEIDWRKANISATIGVVVYGALLNLLWRLVGNAPYYLFGKDNEKKKELAKDAVTGGMLFSPFDGLIGGGIVESALDGHANVVDMFAPELPFTQDAKKAEQYLQNDKYAEFASQALSVLMQSGAGFDPMTAADIIARVATTLDSEQDLSAAVQSMRISQALLSIPQSQYEQILIDEVINNRKDYRDAVEDYKRYMAVHTAPLTWFLRSDNASVAVEKNAEKRFKKLYNERKELRD